MNNTQMPAEMSACPEEMKAAYQNYNPRAAALEEARALLTAAAGAAIQAGEAVKLLCGRPSPLAGRLLWVDLVEQEYQVVSFCPEGPPR